MWGKSRQVVLKKRPNVPQKRWKNFHRLTLRQLLLSRSIVFTVVSLHLEESILYYFYSRTHSVSPKFKATTTTALQKVLYFSLGSRIMLQLWLAAAASVPHGKEEEEEEEDPKDPKGSFPFSASGFDGRKEPFLATNGGLPPFCLGNRKKTTSSSSTL